MHDRPFDGRLERRVAGRAAATPIDLVEAGLVKPADSRPKASVLRPSRCGRLVAVHDEELATRPSSSLGARAIERTPRTCLRSLNSACSLQRIGELRLQRTRVGPVPEPVRVAALDHEARLRRGGRRRPRRTRCRPGPGSCARAWAPPRARTASSMSAAHWSHQHAMVVAAAPRPPISMKSSGPPTGPLRIDTS